MALRGQRFPHAGLASEAGISAGYCQAAVCDRMLAQTVRNAAARDAGELGPMQPLRSPGRTLRIRAAYRSLPAEPISFQNQYLF